MSTGSRRGFTLVEVLVAVVLTALVALLAHQIFAAVADGSRRVRESRLALDRRANAHRLLTAAFLSLEVGLDSSGPFLGARDEVRFSAWLPTPDGWPERKAMELGQAGDRWIARIPPEPELELARGVESVQFDYLLEPGAASVWVGEWESAVSAPLAVRVRVRIFGGPVDTLLYLVKARG